jgi:hypothetical protein
MLPPPRQITYALRIRSCRNKPSGIVRADPWPEFPGRVLGGASHRSLRPSACVRHSGMRQWPSLRVSPPLQAKTNMCIASAQVSAQSIRSAINTNIEKTGGSGQTCTSTGDGGNPKWAAALRARIRRGLSRGKRNRPYTRRSNLQAQSVSARFAHSQKRRTFGGIRVERPRLVMKLILAAALLLASIAHFIIDSAGGASHVDGQAGG